MKKSEARGLCVHNVSTPGAVSVVPQQNKHTNSTGSTPEDIISHNNGGYANVANLRAQREAAKANTYGNNTRESTNVKESGEPSKVESLRSRREAAKAKEYVNDDRGDNNNNTIETTSLNNNSMVAVLRERREAAKASGLPLNQQDFKEEMTDQKPNAQRPGTQFVSHTSNVQMKGKGLRRHPQNNVEQQTFAARDEYDSEIARKQTSSCDFAGTATWCDTSSRGCNDNEVSGRRSLDTPSRGCNDNEVSVRRSLDEKGSTFRREVQCLVVWVLIIIVVVVSIKFSPRRKDSGEESSAEKSFLDFKDILPNYTKVSLLDPASPQFAAFNWLRSDPLFTSYTNSQKLRKFALATFYFSTFGGNRSRESPDFVGDDELNACPSKNSTQNSVFFCNYKELILTNSDVHGGTIPLELGLLTSLQRITIRENNIIGSIPPQIGLLTDLQEFNVGNNSLTGTIPSEIGFLTNVQVIHMDHNSLTGTIPATLFEIDSNLNTSKLSEIFLQNNNLRGTLPTEIGLLTSLKSFDISFNNVEGAIPSQIGFVNTMKILLMQENSLVGSIPTELGHLRNIVRFEIQGNDLTGTIPSELGLWTSGKMLVINLERNSLTGSLPSEIGLLSSMLGLFISLNHIAGIIPSEVGLLSAAGALDFSSNSLSGSIPSEIGTLDVSHLMLQNNSFSGKLPTELGRMHKVRVLYIHSNSFTGVIPSEIGYLDRLQAFDAHSNSLSGTLPTVLGNLDAAIVLSFYDNNFTGTIPSELGRALSLEQFFLYKNSFSGTIPTELCWLHENAGLVELVVNCGLVDCSCGCVCHESMGYE